jgi:TRAP-type C4-dicarboxylate transport system permease large subunit
MWLVCSSCPNSPAAIVPTYILFGILMFQKRYTNILMRLCTTHQQEVSGRMNGSMKQFTVALVSFAVGAVLAGVLGNPKARERLVAGSKQLVENIRSTE